MHFLAVPSGRCESTPARTHTAPTMACLPSDCGDARRATLRPREPRKNIPVYAYFYYLQPIRTLRPIKRPTSDGWGPWKDLFGPFASTG